MGQSSNRKGKKILNQIRWKHNIPQVMRSSKIRANSEVYNDKCTLKKNKRSQINSVNLQLKELENEQTIPKVKRRK